MKNVKRFQTTTTEEKGEKRDLNNYDEMKTRQFEEIRRLSHKGHGLNSLQLKKRHKNEEKRDKKERKHLFVSFFFILYTFSLLDLAHNQSQWKEKKVDKQTR